MKEDALKHVFSDLDEDNLAELSEKRDEKPASQEEQQQEKVGVPSRDPNLPDQPGPQSFIKQSVTPPQTQPPEAEQSVVPPQEHDLGQGSVPASPFQHEELGEYIRMPGSFDFTIEENHHNQDSYISLRQFGRILGDLLERLRFG